jgi:hypothetical protein
LPIHARGIEHPIERDLQRPVRGDRLSAIEVGADDAYERPGYRLVVLVALIAANGGQEQEKPAGGRREADDQLSE